MSRIRGREPALWIGAISALLSVLVGFGLPGLSDALAGSITAVLTAAATAWIAFHTTPVAPTVFSGLISTGAVLLGTLGLHLSQHQIALTAAAAATVMTLITRAQISPVASQAPARN